MREIVLDTETTGLDPATGDRIVEIGAVELLNGVVTGSNFHVYINPERDMPEAAFRVHGLSEEFLRGHPVFEKVADDFAKFIGDDRLVIHNAEFDIKFLNAELGRLALPLLQPGRVVDSLTLARRKHPGAANSLDALCARYGVDTSRRKKHGALLDAELLAEVYIELSGGRQSAFALQRIEVQVQRVVTDLIDERPEPLPSRLEECDLLAHRALVARLGDKAQWLKTSLPQASGDGS
ncbi:MAG: DNA polymerase III subunit epsilon [Beijerinckiaceae bacterium]